MRDIVQLMGDACRPNGEGRKVVVHLCNDIGGWGSNEAIALTRRWPEPELAYRRWRLERFDAVAGPFELGNVQLVRCYGQVEVANIIAQRGSRPINGLLPIRYDALQSCFEKLASYAMTIDASVHMPRFHGGPSGASWERIKPVVEQTFCAKDICVQVYDARPALSVA